MRLPHPTTAAELAERCGAELIGDGTIAITGLNEIHHVEAGDLCFVDHPRYYAPTLKSAASVILIDRAHECPEGKALLVVKEPFRVFDDLVRTARPLREWRSQIHPSAEIGEGVRIAPGAAVGPGVTIGDGCTIGPNAVLYDGVVLEENVTVMAGAVIGGEAFYFKRSAEGLAPWRSGGSVRLEKNVVIGPNSTVARGVSSVTVIGEGTKLDALVQIGHDCKIGKHCVLAAQVGVAGNTTLGDWCVLQGQVGVIQNLTLGDRTVVYGQSGVTRNLEGGREYFGSPAQEARLAFRELRAVRRLVDKK